MKSFEGLPLPFKGTMKQKMDCACRALLARNILKVSKIWVVKSDSGESIF
jgi:hypothetical protein